jgi:hypothetical protein
LLRLIGLATGSTTTTGEVVMVIVIVVSYVVIALGYSALYQVGPARPVAGRGQIDRSLQCRGARTCLGRGAPARRSARAWPMP